MGEDSLSDGTHAIYTVLMDVKNRKLAVPHATNLHEYYQSLCSLHDITYPYWRSDEEYLDNIVDIQRRLKENANEISFERYMSKAYQLLNEWYAYITEILDDLGLLVPNKSTMTDTFALKEEDD